MPRIGVERVSHVERHDYSNLHPECTGEATTNRLTQQVMFYLVWSPASKTLRPFAQV